jgi:hypothetical protein
MFNFCIIPDTTSRPKPKPALAGGIIFVEALPMLFTSAHAATTDDKIYTKQYLAIYSLLENTGGSPSRRKTRESDQLLAHQTK